MVQVANGNRWKNHLLKTAMETFIIITDKKMFDKPRINVLTSKGADDESMVVIILESTKSPVFCMRSETPVAVIVVITITQNIFWEIDFPFDK